MAPWLPHENSEGPSEGALDRAGDCSKRMAGPSLEEAAPGKSGGLPGILFSLLVCSGKMLLKTTFSMCFVGICAESHTPNHGVICTWVVEGQRMGGGK